MKRTYILLLGLLLTGVFLIALAVYINTQFADLPIWLWLICLSSGAATIALTLAMAALWKKQTGHPDTQLNHLQTIEKLLALGIWELDTQSSKLSVNETWTNMLGYTLATLPEPASHFWRNHMHPDDQPATFAALERFITHQTTSFQVEYRMQTATDDWLWVRAQAQATQRNKDGRAIQLIGTHTNLSEYKQLEQRAQFAESAAASAANAKEQFLAVMSHEIRTPLNGVLGSAELLLESPLNQQQRRQMRQLKNSAQNALDLLGDVLEYAQLDAGTLTLNDSEFNLRTLLEQTVREFTDSARNKQISLSLQLPKNTPELVRGDSDHLRHILTHLLSNAISYTPHGKVILRLTNINTQEDSHWLQFELSDTGVGIPEEQQAHIFDAFVQLDSSTRRQNSGAGLGLTVSKRLLKLMGGDISVKSVPGQGSTFTFTVPLKRVKQVQITEQPATIRTDPAQPYVLIAEDNPINLELVGQMMELLGCKVASAENGKAAVSAFERARYDLILMDLRMPEMDGFDATIEIRQHEEGRQNRTPIVALTADVVAGVKERCAAIGMDDYLSKPVSLQQLRSTLERWVPGYISK